MRFEFFDEFDAAHAWHHIIDNDQIRRVLECFIQTFPTVNRLNDFIILGFQDIIYESADRLVIIHDHDPLPADLPEISICDGSGGLRQLVEIDILDILEVFKHLNCTGRIFTIVDFKTFLF